MTIAFAAYRKFVLPELPQCPPNMVDDALRAAAIEFCKITNFHHVATLAQAVTAAGARNVAVTVPTGSVPWVPLWVNWHPAAGTTGMIELRGKTPQELDALVPNWRSQQDTASCPLYYTMRGEANIVLAPWPAADGAVDYDFAFIPTPAATGYIDDLFNLFYEEIALGAKAKLLLLGKQPWSDAALGVAYWQRFQALAGGALSREDRGRTRAPLSTRCEPR